MRSKLPLILGIALSLAPVCLPVLAHHSFAAEFDNNKPVELKGVVTSIEWVNPHAWIHLDVMGADGKVTSWNCELGSPNLLMRNGWRKDSIKTGDAVVISGFAAKDGANLASARTVKTAEGKRVFNAGSSGEPGTPGALQEESRQ